eukprot:1157118-Pelagomonas_calceolata.AAC.17
MGFQVGGRQFTCACMTHSRQQQKRQNGTCQQGLDVRLHAQVAQVLHCKHQHLLELSTRDGDGRRGTEPALEA